MLQRDSMVPPQSTFFLPSLVYDEFDLSAMALRGVNADRGRLPGDVPSPGSRPKLLGEVTQHRKVVPFEERLKVDRPLRDRYFLEYPHAALLLFRAGYAVQSGAREIPVPTAFADSDYHEIAAFEPERPEHVELMRTFVWATRSYVGVMLACWFALVLVLTVGYGPQTRLYGGAALLVLPAALYFSLNRFDIVPALLTAISLACLGRRWRAASAIALGLAVLVKVYPILLAPLVVRYLWPERREAVRWSGFFAATGLLAFTPLLFGSDLEAILAPYRYQLTREPEFGMTIFGCLLPMKAAEPPIGPVIRLGTLALAMAPMLYYPITSLAGVLRRGAVVLLVFATFASFYSPQWVIWLAPLLFPLVRQDRRIGWAYAALDVATYLFFPVWYWVISEMFMTYLDWELGKDIAYAIGVLLRFIRFSLFAVIAWQMIRAEWPTVLRGTWLSRRLPRVAQFIVQKI
jgi:hypothetical protein